MAIPEPFTHNFNTLLRAARDGALALVECKDKATSEPRYVLCAIAQDADEFAITPFGHLCMGNPFDEYVDPGTAMDMDEGGATTVAKEV